MSGPRAAEIKRHLRAAAVMRKRARSAPSDEQKRQCVADADRLTRIAVDMAQADEDAAAFEERIMSRGGVWFPKDGY